MYGKKYVGKLWASIFLAVLLAFLPMGSAGRAVARSGSPDWPGSYVMAQEAAIDEETFGTDGDEPGEESGTEAAESDESVEAEEIPDAVPITIEEEQNPNNVRIEEEREDLTKEEPLILPLEEESLEETEEEKSFSDWYRSAEERGIYDFTLGRWMIGTYYLGESLEELLQMIDDPALPDFDLDTYFRHTVFAGMTREDLEAWKAEGFLMPEEMIPYMPALLVGEVNPVVSVENYSSAVGTYEAFHVQSYPLNGAYGVCVQKGAPIRDGCVYTRMAESGEDTSFYCREAEQILGYGSGQQKAMSRLLSLVNNPDREAAFPGLPESYWVFLVQAGSWSLLDPDKGAACVESDAYFASEVSGLLRWADFVNDDISYVAGGRDWGSAECVSEVLTWLRNWTETNGYARLYWYYVPGTEYQALCVPDLADRVRETGYLELTKTGTYKGTEANIAGVVYGIYRDADCQEPVGSITTDENGYGRSEALPAGVYYVRETAAGAGLCLDPMVYSMEVWPAGTARQNNPYTVIDEEWQGEIQVKKLSSEGEVLSGAVFTLYEYSEKNGGYQTVGNLADQGDGTYVSEHLYYTADNQGRFRVEESQAPAGYLNEGWSEEFVLAKENEIFVREVENQPTRYRFAKIDAGGAPVAGCGFRLLTEEGDVVAEWLTDKTGIQELVGVLEAGKTYTLQETEVPVGYRMAEEQTFIAEASEEVVTIRSENLEIPAVIRVQKKDEQGKPLAGAVFGIYSTLENGEEGLSWEGKTYYYQTRKITDADGRAVFEGLSTTRGEAYLLVEFSTASGYERIGEPIYVGTLPEMSLEKPEDSYTGEVQEKDGQYYLYECSYTVVNRPGYTLPLAGGEAGAVCWPVFWMTGAAALICAWAEGEHRRSR